MTEEPKVTIELPDTKRSDFKVLETSDQKNSLYHPLRREILKALGQGLEGFETEVKKSERTLEDGTIVTEEVTLKKPIKRFWLNVKEVLKLIRQNDPKLKISVFNCYYHLRKLQEQGLVEQFPPAAAEDADDSKRVRGMYFRSAAKFFVPTTFEISTELAERDVLPPEVTEKAVQLAQNVKESGLPGAYEYSLRIGKGDYWFAVTMSLHDDGESIISVVRDITDQRNAQEALRESQERLDLALRGADLAPWDWHHDTGEMVFSESYAKMLGYTLKELRQKRSKWEELVHPDDMDMVLQLWDEHLEGKSQIYSCQYRLKTKYDTYVWVLDRGRVVDRDEEGNPLRSAGTIQDVTADKIMMEALDRSEERYRRLVDESLQGIAILVDERIVFANPAYAETVGREIRDLLRMTADEVWSMVHPDDIAELKKRSRELKAGAVSLPRHRFRYVRPNGEVRWVESYVNVVEHDGEAALQTVEIDITEQQAAEEALRESEKRFKDIFQASPIGILLFDSEGRIIQFNKTAGQILGVSSNSDFEDYRLYDDPNVPSWVWDNVQEEADASFEVSYSPKKARIRSTREGEVYVHVTGSAVQVLEDGTVTTYLVHMRDIADTKRAEFALRESEEKYRNLVESSSLPFIILQGSPPAIVYSNPAASKVSGYVAEELRSMGPEWTTRLIEPRSLSGSLETLRDIQTGALEANPQGYEDRYLHKDGSILWLRAHPTKTTYNGSPALQVHFLDLTEQRALERALSESDEEYRQLLETSDDSVLLLKEGYVFDCNKASLKIFGCKKGEIIDKAFWQLSTRSQPDKSISKGKTQEYLEQVLRTGTQLHRWRFKKCNGRSFEAETTWRQIEFKNDTIVQVQLRPIKKLQPASGVHHT